MALSATSPPPLVVPATDAPKEAIADLLDDLDPEFNRQSELAAEDVVIAYETARGWETERVGHLKIGFDVRSLGPADPQTGYRDPVTSIRRIEVKGRRRGQTSASPPMNGIRPCSLATRIGFTSFGTRWANRTPNRSGSRTRPNILTTPRRRLWQHGILIFPRPQLKRLQRQNYEQTFYKLRGISESVAGLPRVRNPSD